MSAGSEAEKELMVSSSLQCTNNRHHLCLRRNEVFLMSQQEKAPLGVALAEDRVCSVGDLVEEWTEGQSNERS